MFSIETLLKQTKRLETEKYEFEHREELKIKALLQIGLSGFRCQEQDSWCFNEMLPHNNEAFKWNLGGSNQAVNSEKVESESRSESE